MKRTGLLTFNGGMNNVKPIHLLAESEAALVQNLYLSDTGMWTDIGKPEVLANEGTGVLKRAHKIVYWKPAITLADAIDDFVYIVFYTTGEVKLVYRYQVHESKKWKSHLLKEDVSYQDVQVAFDDNQFLWVDGRMNNKTVRVIIDIDKSIVISTIGVVRPLYKPEVVNVGFSNRDDEGTAIKRGKIFLICYTYVNDKEEESNPSPVMVVDDLQYYSRGYYELDGEQYYYPITGGTYHHDKNITGSITNIDIKAKIDYEGIRRINVYLAEADYPETIIPPTGFRLITSKIVPRKTAKTDVVIAMPASMIVASYENDIAPRGDAVTLTGGTAFIGNSVNDLDLPHEVESIWRITLSNLNKFNYTNKWIRMDLFGENMKNLITQDVFEGVDDFKRAQLKRFRMMDSDMTTPLEVFYYKDDGGGGYGWKLHKNIKKYIDYEGVRAYTDIHLPIPNQDYRVEAIDPGIAGNNYTLKMKRGVTQGDLLIDEESGDTITAIADESVDNVGIRLVDPKQENSNLKVDLKENNPGEYRIDIILATDSSGSVSATAQEVVDLIRIEAAGSLAGIISNAETSSYGTFDENRVLKNSNDMDKYRLFECSTTAEIAGNDITVHLGYRVDEMTITAIMADVKNAINSTPDVMDAVRFVSTEQLDAIAIPAQQQFAGGVNPGSPPIDTDTVIIEMLSWIRIPQMLAHQDKSIYLVLFSELPTKIENEFVPLVVSNPSGEEMLLRHFYRDKFVRNPIPNEETYVASGYNISEILQIDSLETEGYSKKNAASLIAPIDGVEHDYNIVEDEVTRYDEKANATTGAYVPAVFHPTNAMHRNIGAHRHFRCGVRLAEKGYMWGSTVIPEDGEIPNHERVYICGLAPSNLAVLYVAAYLRKVNGLWKMTIETQNVTTSTPLTVFGIGEYGTGAGERIHVVVSWDGDKLYEGSSSGTGYSPFMDVKCGILARGKFVWHEFVSVNNIDTSEKMTYIDKAKLPAMFGLRTGVALKDDWQLLSVLRTMPVFPTSSIGALDRFEGIGETSQIVYLNNNISIERMSVAEDTTPGRIQWGAYGAMPDLNEYNIHEDIMGLCPIKSFQPTDEHNTILVFTRDNTYILALLGDSANSCTVIKQLNGIGLVERGALCATHTGVAWLSQQGIMHITSEGTENLTRGRIDVKHITSLIYDTERNWLWARGKDSQGNQHTYVYQLYEMLWWQYSGSVHPDDFVGTLDDNLAWVCYADKNIYKEGSVGYAKDEHNPTLIKTRAIALQKKLSRIKLIGDLGGGQYKLKARLYSDKITGYKETGDFDTNMNSPTAIPGLAADYVQLDIKETNKAIALSLEYEDGVKR